MSTFEGVHEPLVARDVLLGRTTHVRRLVPNKTRRMIGAWCFVDHYGPDDIGDATGMDVPPQRIISQGPYRFTRNPMYLGHLIFMAGLALTF